ncbi:MAG: hypothetical protein JJU09_01435 [Rhodobacteraceae bacterium]|nr:hypothetical protein [Paracoccaceae bacterium]
MACWTSLGLRRDEAHRNTHDTDLVNARHVLDNSRAADLTFALCAAEEGSLTTCAKKTGWPVQATPPRFAQQSAA